MARGKRMSGQVINCMRQAYVATSKGSVVAETTR